MNMLIKKRMFEHLCDGRAIFRISLQTPANQVHCRPSLLVCAIVAFATEDFVEFIV